MPDLSTQRKYVSQVVTGYNLLENSNAMNFNFKQIQLTNINDAGNASPGTLPTSTIDVLGATVVFALDNAGTAGSWVVYNDNDGEAALTASLAATDVKSGLPNNAKLGVVVGTDTYGRNDADVDLDADGETVTVLFRGANNAGVLTSGLDFTAGGTTTSVSNQDAAKEQLEAQGIMVIADATSVTPSHTAA